MGEWILSLTISGALTLYHTIIGFNDYEHAGFKSTLHRKVEKNASGQKFLLFPQCQILSLLPSAKALNLNNESKIFQSIMSCCKKLNNLTANDCYILVKSNMTYARHKMDTNFYA